MTRHARPASSTTSICGADRRPACSSTSARTARPRRAYARGRLLDCFSYNGGFALALGRRCARDDRDRRLRGRGRARQRRTPRATASPSTRASATCSTSCAASSGSASGSTRSCSTRRRSPRTRRRSRTRAAGYKEINLRALKLLNPGRHARHLQLLVQRQRSGVRRDRLRRGGRRAGARHGRREADAGPRSSGAARRAGDLLPEVLHPAESSRELAAQRRGAQARRALAADGAAGRRLRREPLFPRRRAISGSTTSAPARCARWRGRFTRAHRGDWSIDDAIAFADALIADRHLEVKSVGIEVRGPLPARLHAARCCRSGSAGSPTNHSANWATTDAICGVAHRPAARRASGARRRACARGRAIATCGCAAPRSSA